MFNGRCGGVICASPYFVRICPLSAFFFLFTKSSLYFDGNRQAETY